MNATATKTVRERLQDQIASIRQKADEAKGPKGEFNFELAFMLYDQADQLQAQLDDAVEIYKV